MCFICPDVWMNTLSKVRMVILSLVSIPQQDWYFKEVDAHKQLGNKISIIVSLIVDSFHFEKYQLVEDAASSPENCTISTSPLAKVVHPVSLGESNGPVSMNEGRPDAYEWLALVFSGVGAFRWKLLCFSSHTLELHNSGLVFYPQGYSGLIISL